MTLDTQFYTMMTMVLGGIYLGAVYYTFRQIAVFWRHRVSIRYMIEIMFWLVQAAFIYFILYKVNEGVLRIYVFLSLFCGYAMFKALFEQAYQRINNMMFYWVHALYTFVSRIIFYCVVKPIQLVLSVLLLLLTAIYRTIVYLVNVIRTIFTLLAKWMWAIIKVLIPKKILHFFYFILKKYSKIIRKKN